MIGEVGNCNSLPSEVSEPQPSSLLPYLWSLNCIKSSFITVRVLIIYPSSDRSRCSSRCMRLVHTSTCHPSSAAADSEKENVSGMLLCNTMDGANWIRLCKSSPWSEAAGTSHSGLPPQAWCWYLLWSRWAPGSAESSASHWSFPSFSA